MLTTDEAIPRSAVEVSCKDCGIKWAKRKSHLAAWGGRCKSCAMKVTDRVKNGQKGGRKRTRIYGTCITCDKVSPFITTGYCKEHYLYAKGEKHYNWKGGVTTENKYLRSKFLKHTKPKVLERDNYTCQICEQYGGNLHVDHIKKWSDNPEARFDIDNCRTLCMACHYYVTFKKKLPKGVIWGNNLSRRITS